MRRVGRQDRRNDGATVAPLVLCNRRDSVADGPSPKRRATRGAQRKPAVICCAGFCIQPKSLMGQPRVFLGFMFFSLFVTSGLDSWLPFQPPALPRTAGPDKRSSLTQDRNPRQMDHLAGIFYEINCLNTQHEPRREGRPRPLRRRVPCCCSTVSSLRIL